MTWPRGKSKYGNRKVVNNGVMFHSSGESTRWSYLLLEQAAGVITGLDRQVDFKLYGRGGDLIATLKLDYVYFKDNKRVGEDWKGVMTPEFKLKRKLFLDNYPGVELVLTGPWEKIEEKKRAKSRAKYAQKKMLAMMDDAK